MPSRKWWLEHNRKTRRHAKGGSSGGGGGNVGDAPNPVDVTAPTITSSATGNNAENSVLAHALTANEAVTWLIVGGADLARFELSGSTLRWLSNGTKDFEAPDDTGTNNTYVVTVRATDTALNTADQTITITVTDVADTLTAPVLTWVSGVEDNTPLFEGVFTDLQENDVGRLQLDDDIAFGSPIEATNTADAAEVLALQLDYTSGALADGQWWSRVRHERDATVSDWSNVETKTISTAGGYPGTYYYLGF